MTPRQDRRALALLLIFTALASHPGEALAVATPDAARLAALQAEFGPHARVRVRAQGESFLLNDCRVDHEGVRGLRGVGTPGAIDAARFESARVPWAEIDELARYRSHAGRGAFWGAAIGLAGGLAIAVSIPHDPPGGGRAYPASAQRALAITLAPLGGSMLGAVTGFALPSWERAIPE